MTTIHVLTDSAAHLISPHMTEQPGLTVLPNRLTIGTTTYRESIDINAEEALRLIVRQGKPPTITPPSVRDYTTIYRQLLKTSDAVISIHSSRALTENWANATEAARQLGNSGVVVIDSGLICAAQGMLVKVALRAAADGAVFDEVVRQVRGAIERIYGVYYVESLEYLSRNGIMTPAHTTLGTVLGIKPFLTLEDGQLVPIEKVKTRMQALERLIEFTVEFTAIREAVILQNRALINDQTRMLQDRLAIEFPDQSFPHVVYNPSMAAFIGTEAMGVVILEDEISETSYD